jgi:hypothetical protein
LFIRVWDKSTFHLVFLNCWTGRCTISSYVLVSHASLRDCSGFEMSLTIRFWCQFL